MSEIINNVAETLMWDIFLMGTFMLLLMSTGVMWALNSMKDFTEKIHKLIKGASDLDLKDSVISVIVILIPIYYVGIMANTFSDDWIDKHLWGSDTQIKVKQFKKIYDNELDSFCFTYEPPAPNKPNEPKKLDEDSQNEIVDFYYYAKNKLWKDELWKKYILYSQTMINISRVWCLTFFLLFLLALSRIFIRLILEMWKNKRSSDKKWKIGAGYSLLGDVLFSLFIAAIAFSGYLVGGTVWKNSEKEIDGKIFGVYKSEFGTPPRIAKLIEPKKCGYKLTELKADRPTFEASGVAAFEDHLFIVNDKDNNLYVANPQAPECPLKLIEVPKFGKDKAKFEDISIHPESGYFYVIGAHYKTIPNYQKVFRFKLKKKGQNWKPINVEEIPISEDILRHLADRDGVEGIAVAGSIKNPILFVGIRSESPGRFLILEFSREKAGFVMRSSYELKLSPIYSSDGINYHLSGLGAVSNEKLLVLVSSEDKENEFHGNRVYTVDLSKRVLDWVTPEFEQAQKAEGIATWKMSKSERKIAIVFDNDIEDTGKPSRLLILNSLSALCK